ncbi:MAG: hypothetical protein K6G28_04085 [Acholeplasmatales bacterium]|nr:hypothetical protein [Acholeplasmatales bacterium]
MFDNVNLNDVYKIILSAPKKTSKYNKGVAKRINVSGKEVMQFELFTDKQAFHFNVDFNELDSYL